MDLCGIDRIVKSDFTDAFLFQVLLEMSEETSITDRDYDSDDNDVSKLSEPESCMPDCTIKCLLESEPGGVRTINEFNGRSHGNACNYGNFTSQ